MDVVETVAEETGVADILYELFMCILIRQYGLQRQGYTGHGLKLLEQPEVLLQDDVYEVVTRSCMG